MEWTQILPVYKNGRLLKVKKAQKCQKLRKKLADTHKGKKMAMNALIANMAICRAPSDMMASLPDLVDSLQLLPVPLAMRASPNGRDD